MSAYKLPDRMKHASFLRVLNGAMAEGIQFSIDDVEAQFDGSHKISVTQPVIKGLLQRAEVDYNTKGVVFHFDNDDDLILFVAKYV